PHSARPWQGDNAITKAGTFLTDMAARAPREVELEPGLVFREVMSVTIAKGGVGRNVVPPAFECHVNVRFAPGKTVEQAEQELKDIVAGRADVVVQDSALSGAVPKNNPLLERFKQLAKPKVTPK